MAERLLDILLEVGSPRVLLVGDFMLDRYVYGRADRVSPEAPVPVLSVSRYDDRPGGAGSVAINLAELGARVQCVGVTGEDPEGERLRELLGLVEAIDIDGLVMTRHHPTTTKQRIVGLAQHRHPQQLMRIDQESHTALSDGDLDRLRAIVTAGLPDCDVVCLQDYHKGVLTSPFCEWVIDQARRAGKRVLVDPPAVADYSRYRGVWLLKPNRRELGQATGVSIEDRDSCLTATRALAEELAIEHIVVTLDKEGAHLYERSAEGVGRHEASHFIPTRARSVYDVTGAGDMMLAMLTLLAGDCHHAGGESPSVVEMVGLANVAAGLEVERFGCVPVSRLEVIAELRREKRMIKDKVILEHQELFNELAMQRREGKTIVFANGCFDLLHPGHVSLFEFAKAQGDLLVVAANSDESITRLKGPTRPILKQEDRTTMLAALVPIDYVTLFHEDTPIKLIEAISPDILIKGAHWEKAVVGQEWVESHGGEVRLIPIMEGRSTSSIIDQVLEKNTAEQDK